MAPFDAHTNFAGGLVTVAPASPTAGLTMTVAPLAGVVLPATPFNAVVAPVLTLPAAANAEIVRVTNVASGVWTIVRAQENSSVRSILVGDQVFVGFTAKVLIDLENAMAGIGENVKKYGGVGNGIADDTAAIAAAGVAAAASGGSVFFPPGTWLTDPAVLPDHVIWDGVGPGITTIKLKNGSNTDLLRTANFASLTGGSASGPSKYGLRNLTLDANGTNQTGKARCFAGYGFDHNVDNVEFINGLGGGVYHEWNAGDFPEESTWNRFKVWNYMGAGAIGFDWNGPHDSQWTNGVIATLNSSIHQTEAAYGTTPINGSTLTIPANSANGGAGSFTFATSAAADPAIFPTGGGTFYAPVVAGLNTYAPIDYTSAVTVGSVTTFSGCTCKCASNVSVLSGGGIYQPTCGVRMNAGSGSHGDTGLQMDMVHVWGRNHFGIFPNNTTFFASNCEVEGCFVAGVVMTNSSRYTGTCYGTNGQTGQTNEAGIQLGSPLFGCGASRVDATVYNIGGASSLNGVSAQEVNSSGGNSIRVCGRTSHPSKYATWFGAGDIWEAVGQNQPSTFSLLADGTGSARSFSANMKIAKNAPTYSASITPNPDTAAWQAITVTNATAFTINGPSPAPGGSQTTELTLEIFNNSGGAMGAITWNSIFKFAGLTWANPANGLHRYATFKWNGGAWVCIAMSSADY